MAKSTGLPSTLFSQSVQSHRLFNVVGLSQLRETLILLLKCSQIARLSDLGTYNGGLLLTCLLTRSSCPGFTTSGSRGFRRATRSRGSRRTNRRASYPRGANPRTGGSTALKARTGSSGGTNGRAGYPRRANPWTRCPRALKARTRSSRRTNRRASYPRGTNPRTRGSRALKTGTRSSGRTNGRTVGPRRTNAMESLIPT
jgi:hypothetical protein